VIGAITVRTASVLVSSSPADAHNAFYATQRVQRLCEGNERAISAGTSWSDDDVNLELWTGEIDPILNAQNQVTGYVAVGGNDSGQSSTFSLEVFCYTP